MTTIPVKATLDSRGFSSGVDRMEDKVKGFSKSLFNVKRSIGSAFSTGAIASFANQALVAADNVDNLANQLGLTIETTQSLKNVFDEAGIGLEGLNTVMATIRDKQAEAITGNEAAIKSFEALGIAMEDLKGMTPEQALEAVSRNLHMVDESADATKAMFDLLGARGGKMKEALQLAAKDGFGALNESMKEAGRIMEEDVVKRLDNLEERFARQKQRIAAESASLVAQGVSAIEQIAAVAGSLSAGDTIAAGLQSARSQYGELDEIAKLEAEKDAEKIKRNLVRSSLAVATFGASAVFGGKEGKAERQLQQQIEQQKKTNQTLEKIANKEAGGAVL